MIGSLILVILFSGALFTLAKTLSKEDFNKILQYLMKLKYSRIFVESGLTFINFLMINNSIPWVCY